jgi:hypothetical protein
VLYGSYDLDDDNYDDDNEEKKKEMVVMKMWAVSTGKFHGGEQADRQEGTKH